MEGSGFRKDVRFDMETGLTPEEPSPPLHDDPGIAHK
ncbi:hypothetical protein NHJ13051_007387 [Beauveria bassiana]